MQSEQAQGLLVQEKERSKELREAKKAKELAESKLDRQWRLRKGSLTMRRRLSEFMITDSTCVPSATDS